MNYIGNCTEDEAMELIFQDASDIAYVVEGSQSLAKQDFINFIGKNDGALKEVVDYCNSFGFHSGRRIFWAYDMDKDVHYFWA